LFSLSKAYETLVWKQTWSYLFFNYYFSD